MVQPFILTFRRRFRPLIVLTGDLLGRGVTQFRRPFRADPLGLQTQAKAWAMISCPFGAGAASAPEHV